MRAVTIVEGALGWKEHPDPVPGRHEVLVAVHAAGVCRGDIMQRDGMYPPPAGTAPPELPGLELAGEVVALGPDSGRFAVGDRVMAVVAGAGQAELAVLHERLAMPVPDPMDWVQAGAFPENVTTAHDALFTQCALAMGERVCIHGAAGGVGTAAVLLAAAAGAQVVATVRNPGHRDAVAALAPGVISVEPDVFGAHGPFDVVLELVGAPNLAANIEALATGGRISVIGVGAGFKAEVNLLALMAKRATLRASTLRPRPLEQKADAARRVEAHVLPLVAAGSFELPVAATYPMDRAAAAYERFEAGAKLGKIVLVRR
jgi:putative PIG3 family NAD(P)H quinone oxidoreductase